MSQRSQITELLETLPTEDDDEPRVSALKRLKDSVDELARIDGNQGQSVDAPRSLLSRTGDFGKNTIAFLQGLEASSMDPKSRGVFTACLEILEQR